MDTKHKDLYEAPTTEVVELKSEGVICGSGLNEPTNYPGGVDPFGF